MREQTGFDVCSFSCADRLSVRAEEEKKGEELDPWSTRIWTSLFLFVFLTVVGGFAGGFVAFGIVGHQRGSRGNLVIDHFPELLKGLVIGGAILGAISAVASCSVIIDANSERNPQDMHFPAQTRESTKTDPWAIAVISFFVRLIVFTIAVGLGLVWSVVVFLGSVPLMICERRLRR
jgi:hypothetical protein